MASSLSDMDKKQKSPQDHHEEDRSRPLPLPPFNPDAGFYPPPLEPPLPTQLTPASYPNALSGLPTNAFPSAPAFGPSYASSSTVYNRDPSYSSSSSPFSSMPTSLSKEDKKQVKKDIKAQEKLAKQEQKDRKKGGSLRNEIKYQANEIRQELVNRSAAIGSSSSSSSARAYAAPSTPPLPHQQYAPPHQQYAPPLQPPPPMAASPPAMAPQLVYAAYPPEEYHTEPLLQGRDRRREERRQRRDLRNFQRDNRQENGYHGPLPRLFGIVNEVARVLTGSDYREENRAVITVAPPPMSQQSVYPPQQPGYPPSSPSRSPMAAQQQQQQQYIQPHAPRSLPVGMGEKDIKSQDPLIVYSMSGMSLSQSPASSSASAPPVPSAPPMAASHRGQDEEEDDDSAPPPSYESTVLPSSPSKQY